MAQGRTALVMRHGADPIAYSTLQHGVAYFDTSFGYIAYHRAWGTKLTLGPPVCAPGDRRELMERFLRHQRNATFFYLSEEDARLAAALGGSRYRSAVIGVDRVLTLGSEPVGDAPQVRGAIRKAEAAGFSLEPFPVARLGEATRQRILQINEEYLATHPPGSELRFLNRPLDLDLDADGLSQLFVATWTEHGVRDVRAFLRLNPWFEHGEVRGYLLDIFRLGRVRLWGVFLSTVAQLARHLRQRNVRELSLGFCPLHLLTPSRSSRLEREVGFLARHLEAVPYVSRLRAQKAVFAGEDRPRYLVTRGTALRSFFALLSASGAPLRSIAAKSVLRSITRPYVARKEAA